MALDTVVFVYYIEEHPRFAPILDPLFERIDRGRLPAITSALTLLEVLVVPYRAGNRTLAERYEQVLATSRGLRLVDLDRAELRGAAQLRAAYPGLRTPDAIQVSAALSGGSTALLTNDRAMPPIPGLKILQLEEFAA